MKKWLVYCFLFIFNSRSSVGYCADIKGEIQDLAFETFATPHLMAIPNNSAWKPWQRKRLAEDIRRDLSHVYTAFPDETDRQRFVDYCQKMFYLATLYDQPDIMRSFLPVYQALILLSKEESDIFFRFADPFTYDEDYGTLASRDPIKRAKIYNQIFPVYRALSDRADRDTFLEFCRDSFKKVKIHFDQVEIMNKLLPAYLASRS